MQIQFAQDFNCDKKRAYWSNDKYEVSAVKFADATFADIFIKQIGKAGRFSYGTINMPRIPKYVDEVCKEIKGELEGSNCREFI